MMMKDDIEPEKDSESQQQPAKKRRRVPEACHVCRRRKAKCDGARPCSYCKQTNQECIFDPSHPIMMSNDKSGNGSFTDMLRNLQERVKFLESKVGSMSTPMEVNNGGRPWSVVPQDLVPQRASQDNNTLFIEFGAGVSTVNSGTRNIEFYGATSSYAFAAARALFHNNANTPAKISALSPSHNSPSSSKPSPEDNVSKFVTIEDMGMEDLLLSNDTPMPDQFDAFMSSGPAFYEAALSFNDSFSVQRDILDRHIDSFFNTSHTLLPILHEGAFRKLYAVFWKEAERRENRKDSIDVRRDVLDAGVTPLVFAVACHGALYSADSDDQREWARGYFARARRWLSVFETGSFETMIAMYLLATYAQHVFKMNLAYNYLGLAIRLSYSIGLHVFNPGTSEKTIATAACWPGVSKPVIGEMAKRIWWSMYALEVETSLNCGRPMCIRNQDIYIGNPRIFDDDTVSCSDTDIPSVTRPTRISYLIEMAKFSRIVRKVLKVSYSAESTKLSFGVWTEELHNLTLELSEWREALPIHLRTSSADDEEPFWMARQRESIQYHYNHVLLTMYREFLNVKKPFSNGKLSSETGVQKCVEAARDNIILIRDCLMDNPALRNWTHLYYFLLSASLVFIERLNQAPFDQRALEHTRCCDLATEAFEWLRLSGTGTEPPISVLMVDKIVSIIQNCLDEWRKRRDAKQAASSRKPRRESRMQSPSAESDSECSDGDIVQDSQDASQVPQFEAHSSSSSPPQPVYGPRRPPSEAYGQYVQVQHPDNTAFINPQFIPDFYLANSLSFNHGNAIAFMPPASYEPLTALLGSDTVHQNSTSQFRVSNTLTTNASRRENTTPGASRQDEEEHEHVLGYNYNPSERIEKMFGINPTWR